MVPSQDKLNYIGTLLQFGLPYDNIICYKAMAQNMPYIAHIGELWCIFCEYFGEISCNNDIQLYSFCSILS